MKGKKEMQTGWLRKERMKEKMNKKERIGKERKKTCLKDILHYYLNFSKMQGFLPPLNIFILARLVDLIKFRTS